MFVKIINVDSGESITVPLQTPLSRGLSGVWSDTPVMGTASPSTGFSHMNPQVEHFDFMLYTSVDADEDVTTVSELQDRVKFLEALVYPRYKSGMPGFGYVSPPPTVKVTAGTRKWVGVVTDLQTTELPVYSDAGWLPHFIRCVMTLRITEPRLAAVDLVYGG